MLLGGALERVGELAAATFQPDGVGTSPRDGVGQSPASAVRIATFNVNGVNGRLSVLQRWLSEAAPDVVCLQELKAPQDKFPEGAIREAGYGAV